MKNKAHLIRSGSKLTWDAATTGPWKKGVLASAAALTLLGVSVDAQAVALGAVTVRSALGEPLRAEIEVPELSSQDEASFQARMAPPPAFEAAGVAYAPALVGTTVTLQRRPNGQAYLKVVGDHPVNDPFLGLVIEATWDAGRVVRDYTMLIDPPGRGAPSPVIAQPSQIDPTDGQVALTAGDAQATTATQVEPDGDDAHPKAQSPAGSSHASTSTKTVRNSIAAVSGDQVTTRRGDTAYGIVSAFTPEGISLDQMLIALQRANPGAFIHGNVNLLKTGVVLNIPTVEQATAVSQTTARRTVQAQTRDFHAYRRGVAIHASTTKTADTSGHTATGRVTTPKVVVPTPPQPINRLEIDKKAVADAEAAQIAAERKTQELLERQKELEKNIAELNTTLKNATSAASAAQQGGGGITVPIPNPLPTPPEPTPIPEPVPPAPEPDPLPPIVEPEPPKPQPQPIVDPQPKPPEPKPPQPRPPRPAPPPPAPESSLPWGWIGGIGGGLLLAVLGFFGISRLRKSGGRAAASDSSFIESRLQPDSFFGATGGKHINTQDGDGGNSGGHSSMAYSPSQLDAAGDVDPVAEADVYLAYGRDMQAEEILKEALRTAPERMAVHRKLAEIYAKRRDAKALEQVANDALKASQGQGPDWEFIAGLGAELDPDNVLYRPGPGGKAPAAKAVAPTLSDEPPRSSFGAADTEPQSMPFGDSPVSVSSGIPLDLNLELDNAPVKTAAPAPKPAAPAAAPRPVAPQVSDLDFDLDLDAASDARVATQPPPAPSPVAAPEKSNDGMIEFDMDSLSSSLTLDSPGATGGSSEATMQPEAATEPTDSDPLSTKLALAQEFHAIGDTDGARALAKEVIAEASGAIKASAEQFLKELD